MDAFVSKQNKSKDLHMITSIQNIYLFEWMDLLKWRMVELATMTNNKMKKVLKRQEHNGVYNTNEHQNVKKVGWMAKGMTHSKQQQEEHITYHHW